MNPDSPPPPERPAWLTHVTNKMRSSCVILLMCIVATCLIDRLDAQDPPTQTVQLIKQSQTGSPTTTRPSISDAVVRDTTIYTLSDRTVTLQRISDPKLPRPQSSIGTSLHQQVDTVENPPSSLQDQLWSNKQDDNLPLLISATAHTGKATLLKWWYKGIEVQAWSSADWKLLENITEFKLGDQNYNCLILYTRTDPDDAQVDSEHAPAEVQSPTIATYHIISSPPADPSAVIPIDALHQLYNSELAYLENWYIINKRSKSDQPTAETEEIKDITVRFWRVEPDSAETESNQLITPEKSK